MPELEDHPIACIFPLLGESELQKLADDIRENGVQVPIVLFEGKILDGRNRYRAAQIAGAHFQTNYYAGEEPVKHVLSLNLHRRHLNESQRAMVAAKIASLSPGQPEKYSAERLNTLSQPQAAEILNVGQRTVTRAKRILREAPELVAKIECGETTVNQTERTLRPMTPPSAKPTVSLGRQLFAVAKGTMDKIQTEDKEREEALKEMISYCQNRLSSNQ